MIEGHPKTFLGNFSAIVPLAYEEISSNISTFPFFFLQGLNFMATWCINSEK